MAEITIEGTQARRVGDIATEYGVNLEELISSNPGLTSADQYIGQGSKLNVPQAQGLATAPMQQPVAPAPAPQSAPVRPTAPTGNLDGVEVGQRVKTQGNDQQYIRTQSGAFRPITFEELQTLSRTGGTRPELIEVAEGTNIPTDPNAPFPFTNQSFMRQQGQSAVDFIDNIETAISMQLGLGDLEEGVADAERGISSSLSSRPTATQILEEEYARRGIQEKTDILTDLDKQLKEQQKLVQDLPDNLKNSLQGMGITQDQFNRIRANEMEKPLQILNNLLSERNALASEINTAMGFAEKFAGTRLEDQATQLAGLEFELNRKEGRFAKLEEKQENIVKQLLGEQKDVMSLALENPQAGIDTYTDGLPEAMAKIQQNPKLSYDTVNLGGNVVRIGYDAAGREVNRDVLGPSGSGNKESDKTIETLQEFGGSLTDVDKLFDAGSREQFIRMLQNQYPQIDPNDVARKVYETYPDNWE